MNAKIEMQLLHMESPGKAVWQFLFDLLIFSVKSIYFLVESIIYTILPDRYRKLKVSGLSELKS